MTVALALFKVSIASASTLDEANRLVAAGDQAAAIAVLEKLCAQDATAIEARRLLAKLYLWNSQAPRAIPVLQELYELLPDDEELAEQLATMLIQNSRSLEAIPIYETMATRRSRDRAPLDTLVKIYGWHSKSAELIRTLERIHQLAPDDLETMSTLAQHYEWNQRGPEAIPLLETLVAANPEDPELRLRLARQLAATERQKEAIQHLEVATDNDPENLESKFLLAQLCHWALCWQTSETLYADILQRDLNHRDARKYADFLRKDRGDLLTLWLEAYRDSNDVMRLTLGADYLYPIRERVLLQGQTLQRLFLEGTGENRQQINQTAALLSGTYRFTKNIAVDAELGGEHFWDVYSSPVVGTRIRATLWDRVYPQLSYRYQTHINRIQSIRETIRAHTLQASVYAEPRPWMAVSAALTHHEFTDDNSGNVIFSGLWFFPWRDPLLIKPGVTLGYEDFERIYPDALPYYTPERVLVIAPGIDVGYRFNESLRLEAGYSVAFQRGGGISQNPRALMQWNITPFDELKITYNRSGSRVYTSELLRITYHHRF